MSEQPRDIVVLGLGNPLMGDEGIGIEIVARLSLLAHRFPRVEFVDAGTAGLSLLHKLSGRRKALIIDCCRMRIIPGSIVVFGPEAVRSVKTLSHFSLHETDVLKVIELARKLGQCPDEILFAAIEPACIAMQKSLSTELAERLDFYVQQVVTKLTEWSRS